MNHCHPLSLILSVRCGTCSLTPSGGTGWTARPPRLRRAASHGGSEETPPGRHAVSTNGKRRTADYSHERNCDREESVIFARHCSNTTMVPRIGCAILFLHSSRSDLNIQYS